MEQKKDKFATNTHLIYKFNHEWHEGRFKGITYVDSKEYYEIYSFNTFSDLKIPVSDILCSSSHEIKKKMKISFFTENETAIHLPALLKNMLFIDKEWIKNNLYEIPYKITILEIILNFKQFLISIKQNHDLEEIEEVCKGFIESFEVFLPRFLLYETEKEVNNVITTQYSSNYGLIHLIRLLYFLQKKGIEYVENISTKNILMDYTVYLADFIVIYYKDYF